MLTNCSTGVFPPQTEVMPEGDSVAIAAARMHRHLAGHVIIGSDFRVPALAGADLAGQRVTEFLSRGKNMLLRTDAGWTLHTHFKMDGSWSVLGPGKQLPRKLLPDVRVALHLDDGRTAIALRLPLVNLVKTADEATVVGHLGPDLLGADLLGAGWDTDEALRRLTTDPAKAVIEALLDQRKLAGVGNVWAVESCFLRGVFPWRPVGDLGAEALRAHVTLLRRMLRHSVEFRTGQTTTGVKGVESHWVYGRYRKPCRRCGTPIDMVHATVGKPYQRETWWCPRCQPAHRAARVDA